MFHFGGLQHCNNNKSNLLPSCRKESVNKIVLQSEHLRRWTIVKFKFKLRNNLIEHLFAISESIYENGGNISTNSMNSELIQSCHFISIISLVLMEGKKRLSWRSTILYYFPLYRNGKNHRYQNWTLQFDGQAHA